MVLGVSDYLCLAAFFAVVIGVSLYKSRRRKEDSADYFLAGRGLTWPLIGISIVAANISTEQFVGMAGQGAGTVGLAVSAWQLTGSLGIIIIAFTLLLSVNYRWSGYGGAELRDVEAALTRAARDPRLAPLPKVLIGASHGGYLAALAATTPAGRAAKLVSAASAASNGSGWWPNRAPVNFTRGSATRSLRAFARCATSMNLRKSTHARIDPCFPSLTRFGNSLTLSPSSSE